VYADQSGPEVEACLTEHAAADPNWSLEVTQRAVVPDEACLIEEILLNWSQPLPPHALPHCNLILTTGGTGFAPRDVTPEATRAVLQKLAPGMTEAVLAETIEKEPYAMLSRGVAGVRHSSIIVNLPGRPKAVRENLAVLTPVLGHAVDQASRPAVTPAVPAGPTYTVGRVPAVAEKKPTPFASPSKVKPMSGWRPEPGTGRAAGAGRPWASSPEEPPARHLGRAERP